MPGNVKCQIKLVFLAEFLGEFYEIVAALYRLNILPSHRSSQYF